MRERWSLTGDLPQWLCVVIACAALGVALARPRAEAPGLGRVGLDVVVLQDGSASMYVADVPGGTRWSRSTAFLRRLGGTVAQSAGIALGNEVPGVLRAAFKEAAASGQLAIGGAKEDKVEVIATGTLPLRDAEKVPKNVAVDLVAPRELRRVGKPNIPAGQPNGSLDLEIHWDED